MGLSFITKYMYFINNDTCHIISDLCVGGGDACVRARSCVCMGVRARVCVRAFVCLLHTHYQ